jgi:hypothetical protein
LPESLKKQIDTEMVNAEVLLLPEKSIKIGGKYPLSEQFKKRLVKQFLLKKFASGDEEHLPFSVSDMKGEATLNSIKEGSGLRIACLKYEAKISFEVDSTCLLPSNSKESSGKGDKVRFDVVLDGNVKIDLLNEKVLSSVFSASITSTGEINQEWDNLTKTFLRFRGDIKASKAWDWGKSCEK